MEARRRRPPTTPAPLRPPHPSNVSLDKNSYPVFPNADAGADPAVPAEQGGKGFTGEGWETNTDFDLIGDPRAVKGGVFRDCMLCFPGTLRMAGPEWNTIVNYAISGAGLRDAADAASDDARVHAGARHALADFAGQADIPVPARSERALLGRTPVTAEDVVASWMFHTDKSLQDLFFYTEFTKLEKPVAESKYIVRIKAKELQWRNFLIAATGMRVFPAHVLKTIDGAAYLSDYNFKLLPGTGPYTVDETRHQEGHVDLDPATEGLLG